MINADGHICLRPSLLYDASLLYGNQFYLAPEILKGEQHYAKPADMWSVGVMIFELLTGLPPFYSPDSQIYFKQILEANGCPRSSVYVHGDVLNLLDQLLLLDPSKRLCDFARLKSHAFFSAIDWNALLLKKVSPPFIPPASRAYIPFSPEVCD